MNRCTMQPTEFTFCPKPRRLSPVADPLCRLAWLSSHQSDLSNSSAGANPVDYTFVSKDGDESKALASSPPFFCGSPPDRTTNPVIHDARFREELPLTQPGLPPMSSKQSSCAHAKFGPMPAAVRIEGFDCHGLGRGRRSCSVQWHHCNGVSRPAHQISLWR